MQEKDREAIHFIIRLWSYPNIGSSRIAVVDEFKDIVDYVKPVETITYKNRATVEEYHLSDGDYLIDSVGFVGNPKRYISIHNGIIAEEVKC